MTIQLSEADVLHLLKNEKGSLLRMLARMVGKAEADDLFQEVSVKALEGRKAFRGESGAPGWLHRIARNTALDHLKSRRHRQARKTQPMEETEEAGAFSEPAVGAKQLVAGEMTVCVRDYVAKLPAAQREILELKDLQGLTSAGVAKHLGISLDAAKIRLHRARAALRRELERGCEFYQNETGTLACDRRAADGVSLAKKNSSEQMTPENGARRSGAVRRKSKNKNNMSSNSSSNCCAPMSCAAPAPAAETGSIFTPIAAEFVALGAAIGANCELCLRHHTAEALKVGISIEDIARAIEMAEKVKRTPAQLMQRLAERLIKNGGRDAEGPAKEAGGCGCS